MAVKNEFKGLEEGVAKLSLEISKIEGRTIGGLLGGGMIVLGESNRRVPVEYGNLRASGYVQRSPDDPNAVEVGYTASYALSVHENLEQKLKGRPRQSGLGVYWGPSGQPKYLTSAAVDKGDEVVAYVAREADK